LERAYFEEEGKPFKNRWPEGKSFAEDRNPFGKNVITRPASTPKNGCPPTPKKPCTPGWANGRPKVMRDGIDRPDGGQPGPAAPLHARRFPHGGHAGRRDVVSLKPVMGYLHRNHEKIGERNTFLQNMPFTDRLDYFNSMSNNFGYALASRS
jgi:NADH-quinone oxidoreductase subunit C/D